MYVSTMSLITIQYNTKFYMATKHSAMLMANKVIKWKVLTKRSNVHTHTAPSAIVDRHTRIWSNLGNSSI